jgi:hypothetical protein
VRERPGSFRRQQARSIQIRKQEQESCTGTGARTNQSCHPQACRSGSKVQPSALDRRTMIENIAVTVNAVLSGSRKMDALILEFYFS